MTTAPTASRTTIRDAALGALFTLGALIALSLLTGGWSSKESVTDHRSDIQAVRADIRRVLDVVCTDHPHAPQCGSGGQP